MPDQVKLSAKQLAVRVALRLRALGLSRPDSIRLALASLPHRRKNGRTVMKLTRTERWILSNQYKILEKLDPTEDERKYYARIREVLECGYELEYDWAIPYIYDGDSCLTAEQCKEVLEVLSMHRDLHHSYENLKDKSGVDAGWLHFRGFDGNTESVLLGYCEHVFAEDKFKEIKPTGGEGTNSHLPMMDFYRRMMAAWRPLAKLGRRLTKAEIITIINEAPHVESPLGRLKNAPVKGPVQ